MKSHKIARAKLFLVAMIFIFPILAGTLLYHFRESIHFKTLNHGTLVRPPVDVSELWQANGKWQIVFVTQACPSEQDEKTMFLLHQLRIILGNDSRRVNLVLMTKTQCLKITAHDFQVLTAARTNVHDIGKYFEPNKIYLVDPKNYLFMSYDQSMDLMNVYNDLKRVLEVSQIG